MTWYRKATTENLNMQGYDTRTLLEKAVNDYLSNFETKKPAYYIQNPKNYHFDPKNPDHVKEELGETYDPSLDVKHGHHPSSFKCKATSASLAGYLARKGYKARLVAGWYGNAEPGYYTGQSPSLSDTMRPDGFGTNPQEHWWVEAEGYYIDVTSDQFHPRTPTNQVGLVIKEKPEAIKSGEYLPVRRFPLGRAVKLPDGAQQMVNKIVSLKAFRTGHSTDANDNYKLCEWIKNNGSRYGLTENQVFDISTTLASKNKPGFYLSDVRSLERLFGEAFDNVEEDESLKEQDKNAGEYKRKFFKPNSLGTFRIQRRFLSLSSVNGVDLRENFEKLKSVILSGWTLPESLTFSETKLDQTNNYGTVVFTAYAELQMQGRPFDNPFTLLFNGKLNAPEQDVVRKILDDIKAAGFKIA